MTSHLLWQRIARFCLQPVTIHNALRNNIVWRPNLYHVSSTGQVMSSSFLSALSDVLDRVFTFTDPTVVVNDINIRPDRPCDVACRVTSHHYLGSSVVCRLRQTHDQGSWLDLARICCCRLSKSSTLLSAAVDHVVDSAVYTTTTTRPWCRLRWCVVSQQKNESSTAVYCFTPLKWVDDCLRAAWLRHGDLGVTLMSAHSCPDSDVSSMTSRLSPGCGSKVDSFGRHILVCTRVPLRTGRHHHTVGRGSIFSRPY